MNRTGDIKLDAEPGELYHLPALAPHRPQVLKGRKIDGSYVLIDERNGKKLVFSASAFASMRGDGRAIRISRTSIKHGRIITPDPNPLALMPEDDEGISAKERKARASARRRLVEGQTLLFYVRKHDDIPGASKGPVGLPRFIDRYYPEALAAGFSWKPSDSAVRKALRKGSPGNRSYADIVLARGEHDPAQRWPDVVLRLKERVINYFYSARSIKPRDAQARFFTRLNRLNRFRKRWGLDPYEGPDKKTVERWLHAAKNAERWATKYGKRLAHRHFGGRQGFQVADMALEIVIIDHTEADMWVVILDEDGFVIARRRPWLAVACDLFSGTILAAVLTLESPSIGTLMACVRQTVRPRDFLRKGLRDHKGAQGWGKPATLIVDNGLEGIGISFQVACENAGMEVQWAPVRCPEFKGPAERFFDTLNDGVWHKLRGAVPRKAHRMAELGLDGHSEAYHTLAEANELLWDYIVTIHHVEAREGRKAPARAMTDSLMKHGRRTVDDVSALDKVLGKAVRRTLSAEGVSIGGLRFHDPETTSDLLDGLLRFGKAHRPDQEMTSGKVQVLVTKDPYDCSYVHVWHPIRKCHVRLPAWNHAVMKGLSWKELALVRRFARLDGRSFHSDEEMWAAREAFNRKAAFTERTEREKKPQRKPPKAPKAQPKLINSDRVERAGATPTVNGSKPVEIKFGLAVAERTDDLVPPVGPRRSSGSNRHAPAVTRRQPEATSKVTPPTGPEGGTSQQDASIGTLTNDADELLAALAADLD